MAEKKFFVDINLQGSALTNAKIGTNTGIGSTEGAFGYDSAAHRLQYFDGTATKDVANLSDIAAVTGGLIFQGGYDPTTNTPDITDGSALKGFFWAATAAGTFLGESVQVGDSIVAKVDNAGTTLSDWLILQGNIVIATDSVDGISRLATQTEANDGTEAGAVVITPATLQGKIDAQITPEISNKLPLAGGTMSGNLNMGNNDITGVDNITATSFTVDAGPVINGGGVYTNNLGSVAGPIQLENDLNVNGQIIYNLPAPTNDGDAANKLYVDNASNDKLPLAGGTMSGSIDMGGNAVTNVDEVTTNQINTNFFSTLSGNPIGINSDLDFGNIKLPTNLPAPTNGGDAANKTYVDGAASTAESNANAYTDTAIATSSAKINILAANWILDGNIYYQSIDISAFGEFPIVQIIDPDGAIVEFYTLFDGAGNVYLQSNILPTSYFYLSVTRITV